MHRVHPFTKMLVGAFLLSGLICLCSCHNEENNQKSGASAPEAIDTPQSNDATIRELASNFLLNTNQLNAQQRAVQLDSMLYVVSGDSLAFRHLETLLVPAFGDPNSSYRNEDLYIHLLDAQLQSPWYSRMEKQIAENKRKLAIQNRVGQPANNFTYITPEGVRKKMFDIKARRLMLYFYNPECHSCIEMKATLNKSPVLTEHLVTGDLKLLAIYTDADFSIWTKHLPENPATWINGRDDNEYLFRNGIYNLKAIPCIYLLNENKQVILKDCMSVKEIEDELPKIY